MLRILSFVLLITTILSCSRQFSGPTARQPDYSKLAEWAAHPWKTDPSDSTPAALQHETHDSTVDVFFIHPTTLTSKKQKENVAWLDDSTLNRKTDLGSILYQASVFNRDARIFAPRYRQAHIRNFYIRDTTVSIASFDTAYADIRNAFIYYLAHFNNGHPIIIAAHSQGSKHAERLLKEFFDGKTLSNKLVVAYLPGWPLPRDYFSMLRLCVDSNQTGCVCSWRTFRNGYLPSYIKPENGSALVTNNPLTWTTTGEYAPKKLNKGAVLKNFNRVYEATTGTRISNGVLYINKPKFPFGFLYLTRNYHIADINLFYVNIRDNVTHRIGLFWKQ